MSEEDRKNPDTSLAELSNHMYAMKKMLPTPQSRVLRKFPQYEPEKARVAPTSIKLEENSLSKNMLTVHWRDRVNLRNKA